jgi:hypothetical protein
MEPKMTERPNTCTECGAELFWEADASICECGVVYMVMVNVTSGEQRFFRLRLGKGWCHALRLDLEEPPVH